MVQHFTKKITRFGYIVNKNDIDDKLISSIKSDLTVKPFKVNSFNKYSKNDTFSLYIENGDYIGIPKYYGLSKLGPPDINKVDKYKFPKQNMIYTGTLRPRQQIVVDKIIDGFNKVGGGVLVMGCGSGKTNIAIYLACHFNIPTLFIVHKTFLKNQVIDRIKSNTNIKKIGIIQQKKIQTNYPFVVGMVQSLSKINYDDEIFKNFGMVIIDEVHHMGAKNFSKVYQKISSKYMLGISAEHNRTDGMYKIINWYMGPILHMEEQKPNDMVIVKTFFYKTSNKNRIEMKFINNNTKEPNRSKMITNLIHIARRNQFILSLIKELFDQGKNILCLSGRLKQINMFHKLLEQDKYTKGNVGKYIGKMTEEDLKISSTKQIIIGSYEMASEGLDIENLNVVILCTPKTAIKQSVGRILRKENYEEHPLVIDITDMDNPVFFKQSTNRKKYYTKQKYNIQNFYISDFEDKTLKYKLWNDDEYLKESLLKKPDPKIVNKNDNTTKNNIPIDIDTIDFIDD
ncbi:DNA or RNA helicase of superfamily II [Cotonvirus japonicus]|uniref:DNA or RNA helicase of superfamily II n=1 Tax=Cotonvirus japonicus TaxID=2811091 RepID=A0ABM7NSN9_9VIRU|nr:DNA or RNA helicase of superfamily II [Cotonvirus japonicus]BCS83163.1 DNA or RNA helicase of superfamily II [Cotonvirus japonicus]